MTDIQGRITRATEARAKWVAVRFGRDGSQREREATQHEYFIALEMLHLQLAPETRERSEPLKKLMHEARQVGIAELAFTTHDRVQVEFREGQSPEFVYMHNNVQVDDHRIRELIGF